VSTWVSPTARARFVRRFFPDSVVRVDDTQRYQEWWAAQNEDALAASGPLWIALGDSIALGIGASAPDRGFVGQLLERLRRADGRPWRVVNLSVSGARLNDVRRDQLPLLHDQLDEAELVTCTVGVNDVFKSGFRHTPGRIRALTRALPAGTVVATVPHGFLLWETVAFNVILRREARAAGLRVADVWAHTGPPYRGKHCADRFHPSDAGHADWCAAFAESLGLTPL
jgi:lysophospholipase L1-like esterase